MADRRPTLRAVPIECSVCGNHAKYECVRCGVALCTHHASLCNYDDALCHICRRQAESGRNRTMVRCMDRTCTRLWSGEHMRVLSQSIHEGKVLWVSDKMDDGTRCYGITAPIVVHPPEEDVEEEAEEKEYAPRPAPAAVHVRAPVALADRRAP